MAIMAAGAFHPQISTAEGFTGTEFLTWNPSGQDSYIRTSVTMATFLATRTNPPTATCLDDWYAASVATSDARHTFIREKIGKNAEYHPSAVILLVLEEACGAFTP